MDEGDRAALKTFLDEFADEIDYALEDAHAHWFPPDVVAQLRRAWVEVRPRLEEIKSAIDDQQNQSHFDREGFTGNQMAAKIAVWRARSRPSWWRSALGWLRPFQGALKIADAILESIGRVVPAAGAVEEFKKILEGSLDVGEGRGPITKAVSFVRARFRR